MHRRYLLCKLCALLLINVEAVAKCQMVNLFMEFTNGVYCSGINTWIYLNSLLKTFCFDLLGKRT